jgi:hypothetical protein
MPLAVTKPLNDSVDLRCVWPDYQPIRSDMDIDPIIATTLDCVQLQLKRYGINRVFLINDVVYPFNNIARDVLRFESADVQRLGPIDKQGLYDVACAMASRLTIDPATPSQAVMWKDDIYILMSARAAMLKPTRVN